MMESIKNVAMSDLVPSFFFLISPLFPSQYPCDKILLHVSMDSTLLYGLFRKFLCAQRTYHFNVRTKCGAYRFFRKFLCTRRTYHAQPTILGLAQAHPNNLAGYVSYQLKLKCWSETVAV